MDHESDRTAASEGPGGNARGKPDAIASTAGERLVRGLARAAVGRDREARADFVAALPELGDACRVELALLDIRERADLAAAHAAAQDIVRRTPAGSPLGARALHVLGFAEGKLRRTPQAVDALQRAADAYGALDRPLDRAQVHDTLGSVLAAAGQLGDALTFHALSLVPKLTLGDVAGAAITLGNMGRIHLRAGRLREALLCFREDLALAGRAGDGRGQARVHEDIGRTLLESEDLVAAETELEDALRAAQAGNWRDLEFFARVDLARLKLRAGRLDDARAELDRAEAAQPPGGEAYDATLLLAARGEWQRAAGDKRAVASFEQAARQFGAADLPDLEVPALVAAAELRLAAGDASQAEVHVRRALDRAGVVGLARFLPAIREVMGRLGVREGLAAETGRLPADSGAPAGADGYVLLAPLGQGAFGRVWRAFDPRRGAVVALKRLELDRLYDPDLRRRLEDSARRELEAAARLRHPGIARVLAVGTDPAGGLYVVQDYVDGVSLREHVPEARADEDGRHFAIETAARIAAALAVLHEQGVVHRDLKPENVIVRAADGAPVLVDFGIAHVPARRSRGGLAALGTLGYLAPEQAAGKAPDGRADVYALGVILFELLAGVRPLIPRGATLDEQLRDLQRRQAAPLSDFVPDAPRELANLVAAMLSRRPRRRLDAREAWRALTALAMKSSEG